MTDRQFSKRVEYTAVDSDQQIATGGVFVPNKVDLQGDFARPGLIERWSADFMRRLQSADAEGPEGGVMHVAFPDDHVSLVENTVLDTEREIGGKAFPAGSWIQEWQFHDDELWSLVEENILSGYSIGGREMSWSDPMAQEDLPADVTVAADYPDDEPVRELLDGTIVEVSSVDIPAVPDAEIVDTKALAKALPTDKDEFIAEMADRGHTDEEAERLWRYLQRVTGGSMAAADGPGWLQRAKQYFSRERPTESDNGAAKESRTLSQANRQRLMAAHDAIEDALSSDVEFIGNRFTDDPATDFDVADYDGKLAGYAAADDAQADKDDPGDETPDETDTETTMSDDPFDDAPAWATTLREEQQANSDKINDLAEKVSDDNPDNPDDPEKAWDDAPAWAKQLREQQDQNAERVADLAESAGKSQQLAGGDNDSNDDPSKADVLGLPGGDD